MKKTLITLALAVSLATPAMAETPRPKGCNGYGIGTFFDEDANGENCPPSNWEKTVGDLGRALIFIGIASTATGKVSFPVGG